MIQARIILDTRKIDDTGSVIGPIETQVLGIYPLPAVPRKKDVVIIPEEGNNIAYIAIRSHIKAGEPVIDVIVRSAGVKLVESLENMG